VIGTSLALAGVLIGLAAVYLAIAPQRRARTLGSIDAFRRTRSHLKRDVGSLYERSLAEQDGSRFYKELPILTREHWIPPQPLPSDAVELELRELTVTLDPAEARRRVSRYLPRRGNGSTVDSYSEAIGLYDRPQVWFNGGAYRLMDVVAQAATPGTGGTAFRLTFGPARYFDGQDTSEFLGLEAAERAARGKRVVTGGAYRAWLADPFDFSRRAALPGISTLTIRRSSKEAYFFMHRRDPSKVAVAMNATNVSPAGEFQPYNDVLPAWQADLNLWHNVMREYAEEFLGRVDSMGQGGSIIDYELNEPYSGFAEAKRQGAVVFRFLGIGLDPLNWKPEICTVCIWKDSVFDKLFKEMVEVNEEGVIVVGERAKRGYHGMRFNAGNVLAYANTETTFPPGRTCLRLAWKWRHLLQIPGTD